MTLIPVQTLSGIADRVASQVGTIKTALNSATNTGTPYYQRIYTGVGPLGNWSVETQTINSAHALDINTISGTLFKNMYSSFLQDIQTQVTNNGAASFDNYLIVSGIHVAPNFEDAWYQCIGSHLSAVNVFFQDANLKVATWTVISSGAGTYASVQPVGTGVGSFVNGTINYAPAKMVLVPVQTVGANPIQVNLRLLAQNPAGGTTPTSCNILIPNGALSGTQFIINTTSGQFLDCNNIVALGGTAAEVYNVYALNERPLGL